jgi:hypothetical protein
MLHKSIAPNYTTARALKGTVRKGLSCASTGELQWEVRGAVPQEHAVKMVPETETTIKVPHCVVKSKLQAVAAHLEQIPSLT